MSVQNNNTTNNDGSSSCPAPTDETPPPALYTEDEMRDVLGDYIYDRPSSGSDEVEPELSEDLEKPTNNFETVELDATRSRGMPDSFETLSMMLEEFFDMEDVDIEVQFGEVLKTSANLPPFITDSIDFISKKQMVGKKKACSFIVASGVTYMGGYMDTPVYKAVETNEDLFRYIRWVVESDEMSPMHIKSATRSIKKISIVRDGDLATKSPVYIHQNIRGYIDGVCNYYRLNEVDCLRLVISVAIVKSMMFNKRAKALKKIAQKEIDVILDKITETANKVSRERSKFYLQNTRYLDDDDMEYVEKQMIKLDKILGVPHCKFCLSNNTKLRSRKRNQYKCHDCQRSFTPKSKK